MNNDHIHIDESTIQVNLTFRNLVCMNLQQLTNFPYIENDFDALTDYELLCLVVKFLNDIINNQNEQNASITRMYNAFLALQDYMNNQVQYLVNEWNDKTDELETEWENYTNEIETAFNNLQNWIDNYFDNLDVQEEINNKLDEMLEDGVLEQIIEQFIQSTAIWCFDTVAGMKSATNLINGSFAKTLGYYSVNDGGMSTYKIRTKTNDDIPNEYDLISLYDENLVAEYIEDKVVNIKQLGYINTMTTAVQTSFLNYVFNKYKNILIKNENITINNSIQLIDNQNIILDNSNIHNISIDNQIYIFNITEKSNISIKGIHSDLYFDKPSQPQQACIRIRNSHNININGLNLKSAGGDGIIVAGSDNTTISSNINVSNCLIDNNRRNGISLIGGLSGFYLSNCTITNTSGTNPQYAIDLEPWQDGIYNNDVIIDNCILKDNVGGIDLMADNRNVTIKNCKLYNGINSVLTVAKGESAYPKNIIIENNDFETNSLYLRGTQYGEYKIINNNFKNGGRIITDSESDFTNFYQTGTRSGYLHIINNSIKNSSSHGIAVSSSCNILIKDNYIENPINRGITVSASNNVKIVNNTIKDYAQNETNKENIWGIYIATSYNTLIDGNIFFNSQEVTFVRVISIQASCQRLITINNIALDLTYTNFLGKDGTITKEVYANNLTN